MGRVLLSEKFINTKSDILLHGFSKFLISWKIKTSLILLN